jgi:hypothetical protein
LQHRLLPEVRKGRADDGHPASVACAHLKQSAIINFTPGEKFVS